MIRAGPPEPAGSATQSSLNMAGNAASLDRATGGSARRPQTDVARRDIPEPGDLALPCASELQLLVDRVTTVTNAPHGRAGACRAAPWQAMAGRGRAAGHGPNRRCRDRNRTFHVNASTAGCHHARFRPPARACRAPQRDRPDLRASSDQPSRVQRQRGTRRASGAACGACRVRPGNLRLHRAIHPGLTCRNAPK